MTFQARRGLLLHVAARYRAAGPTAKRQILDEFVAVTGYNRKYAIHLLGQDVRVPPTVIRRSRARRYGPAVEAALRTTWAAAN